MEDRTRAYLRGRFSDYYRRVDVPLPPSADEREWGFIPWTEGPDETMVRHRDLLDIGDVDAFLRRKRPRHVYFSAGRYETPGASTMAEKDWTGADLVFDIDADHLPTVTLGEDTYAEMLAKSKDALVRLLDFLERDFGFDDLSVVFSGGRGYHVHVRDETVFPLERDERREIVDYVRGNGVAFESLVREETVSGLGVKNPTTRRTLPADGGWGRRAVDHIDAFVDELLGMDERDALLHLQTFDGVGEKNAEAVLNVVQNNTEAVRAGNVDVHPAFLNVARQLLTETVDEEEAPIDEPVTTDTHRLIRLPGSLHGGSGLAVTSIDRDALADFDPLTDAVPETFVGHEIRVDVEREYELGMCGETITVTPGEQTLPEYAGVFLMARGWAEKATE
ncbi:DNA primase small subunit [Halarchaeum acidiphilum MH1-52-1]|uniref:DNA primase small subunit PriS n=1 Tax=Halarchaeum acidiphilum MH1-52-1 TaxID=1261545 RepID=U2YV14_9EURY|nr:DNA primase small subunit PriS [Halarchaeum acidiphilum]GAD52622.1 DNA primase small subunit [Halarchaeum acidiphilum MH1-52-1]